MPSQFKRSFRLFFLLVCLSLNAWSNNAAYLSRQQQLIDSTLQNSGPSGITLILQAYRNIPIDTANLNSRLVGGPGDDFSIIQWVRFLCLTNGRYDQTILPVLYSVPYWITNGATTRGYWSENHMIMWMSSDWLLHEKFGKPVDSCLRKRLVHYLDLKINYGFYEFLSSTYSPFTLSGLLNLADFSQDPEISTKAAVAARKLLHAMLLPTTDLGIYYSTSGRGYPEVFENAYGRSISYVIYLLTGFGPVPSSISIAGSFLATSSLEVDSVINAYSSQVDTVLHIGHSLDSGFVINSGMSAIDKTVFQWSSGSYFHPLVVSETVQLLSDSNMWNHTDFRIFSVLAPYVTPQDAPVVAESLGSISKSSVICREDVAIFKHHEVALSSALDLWKGKVGFQQYPCVAAVGTASVYTASGEVKPDWNQRNRNNANIHLPYVMQKKNVALMMYRPEPVNPLVGTAFSFKDVALHFKDSEFDEVTDNGLWLIGRQSNNYVAVKRNCIGTINGLRACPSSAGQAWALVVGDSAMYGGFNAFQTAVQQSRFEERWYFDSLSRQTVYYAKVVFDSTSIEHAWGVDSIVASDGPAIQKAGSLRLYPNPATDLLIIGTEGLNGKLQSCSVFNALGQKLAIEDAFSFEGSAWTLNCSPLSPGLYELQIKTETGSYSSRFIKRE